MLVVGWQKALVLWFQEKVEVIEYYEVYVHSSRARFRLPSVMRLKSYVKPRRYQRVRFCRDHVYLRDENTCQYCAEEFPTRVLTLDHVRPISRGGPTSWENVVAACRDCNQKKGNRTPEEARMPLLNQPVEPSWLPDRVWSVSEERSERFPMSWLPYLNQLAG